MLLGIEGRDAARYSFLLSVPTIILASLKKTYDIMMGQGINDQLVNYLVGFVFAALFGVLAIKILISVIGKGRMAWFGVYCALAGVAGLLLN